MAASQGVAVLAPIKQGQESACSDALHRINNGASDSIIINFAKQNRTHFARFVIIDDPDKGVGRKRLLFSGIYDGRPADFFRDIQQNCSDLDAIWGHCEGWTGKGNTADYLAQHDTKTATLLKGFRFDSVKDIQGYLHLRDELINRFDVPLADYPRVMKTLPRQAQWFSTTRRIMRDAREFLQKVWVTLTVVPDLIGLLKHGKMLLQARKIINTPIKLDREFSYAALDKSAPCYPLGDGDEVIPEKLETELPQFLNRQQVQNQMTVITVNDPKLIAQQEAITDYIGTLAKIPFISRNSSIPTIHFGRWLQIDNSKRMLFLSNFDGNWETYIGDFVDKAAGGLNAFWGGSIGWRQAATLDIELFKEGIRCHQTRAHYFYCAYPQATVVNIARARDLARAYALNVDETTAEDWLKFL